MRLRAGIGRNGLIPYLLNFIFLLVLYGVLDAKGTQSGKRSFCIVAAIVEGVFFGLADPACYRDGLQYQHLFELAGFSGLENELSRFWQAYFVDFQFSSERGFYVLMAAFQCVSESYVFFQFCVSVFFFSLLYRFFYHHSKDPLLSSLFFTAIFAFAFMSLLRQTLAICIAVLIGTEFIYRRKAVPFLICVLVACTMHQSALIFLPLYWLAGVEPSRGRVAFGIACAVAVSLLSSVIWPLASVILGDYQQYFSSSYKGSNTSLYFLLQVVVAAFVLLHVRKVSVEEDGLMGNRILLYSSLIMLMIAPFSQYNSNVFRISYYYFVLIACFLPALLGSYLAHGRVVAQVGFVAVMLCALALFGVQTDVPYEVFFA